jgi:hypothetical protein
MFSIQQSMKGLGRFVERNSTHILTGIAVTGTLSTAIFAVKATPKAVQVIEEFECKTTVDKVKVAWKFYVPTALSFIVTTTAIIGMNVINERKKAALVGLYSITQSTLQEYQQKVIETIGEKKEQSIRDSIDEDRVLRNPPTDVIITGSGDVLCLDSLSGRYFQSDIEKIKRTINETNRILMNDMFISLNDFYYDLGLEPTKLGDDLGFNIEDGLIEVHFSSQLTKEGKPCLVLSYEVRPRN